MCTTTKKESQAFKQDTWHRQQEEEKLGASAQREQSTSRDQKGLRVKSRKFSTLQVSVLSFVNKKGNLVLDNRT